MRTTRNRTGTDTSLRAGLGALLLLVGGGLGASCDSPWATSTRPNGRYCDATTPCSDPSYPVCDLTAKQCNAGTVDGGMPDVPDLSVRCTATPPSCMADAPVCGDDGKCRTCAGAADDAACAQRSATTPRCGASGSCVACRSGTQATDCAAKTPVCDGGSSTCRGCQTHAECASGACLGDGSCAPAGMVAFVDNGGKPVADCKAVGGGDGSAAHPFCDVQDAIPGAATKPIVVVAGSKETYSAVSIMDGTITLLGPLPATATPRATVAANGPKAALLVGAPNAATVTIERLELTSATGGKSGLNCLTASTATVNISRSWIHDNNGPGISATSCNLTVDASSVASNQGGGISLAGGTYQITNSFITGNGNNGPGVSFNGQSTGRFAFNTVSGNTQMQGAGVAGIDCGLGQAKAIEDSIVVGNTPDSGSQLAGKCTLTAVVVGVGDTFTGGKTVDPAFVDRKNGDYHLLPNDQANAACCIDQVMTPGTPNSDHDVDFSKRPKGASWDIGAHEAK